MNKQTPIKILVYGSFLLFASIFLISRGPSFLSSYFSNFGAVYFNHSRANDGSRIGEFSLFSDTLLAERALERAIELSESNKSAWRMLGYIRLDHADEVKALDAWQHVPVMGNELLEWALRATNEQDLTSALTWYRRHTTFLPELGDSWYYQGQILAQQKKWPQAITAFQEATRRESFQTPLLSDAYFQLGFIYQSITDYRDLDKALLMYDIALRIDKFSNEAVKAETFYKQGEIYSWLGDYGAAVIKFEKALAIIPTHTWAHLRHSYSGYWVDKELEPAEQGIKDVITVWKDSKSPNLKWAYQYLGNIYEDAGMIDAAIAAYEEVMQFDPTNVEIRDMLAGLENEQ
jgi:tetratricopeptide (TPR) repeat protein